MFKKFCICLFIAISFLYVSPMKSFAKGAGTITELSGNVFYREKDDVPYHPAGKGTEINVGYWLKTGADGWAILTLSDGSNLTLANNTELKITKFIIDKKKKDGIFNVLQGKIRASVVRIAGESVDYKVQSPTAVAGIKGTEFMMMIQGPANVFFGNEGVAEISGNAAQAGSQESRGLSGVEVVKPLSAGTLVQNTRGYTPVDPVQVRGDTPLNTAEKDFEEITAATPPRNWEISNNLPHIIARWDINYGHYLADTGKYDEALYVFQIALDLTTLAEIRSDARLQRGAVYSRFLRNPEAALSEYLLVVEQYPQVPQRETALYLAGMTLYEMGLKSQAREKLIEYRKDYPNGRNISNVETILNTWDK